MNVLMLFVGTFSKYLCFSNFFIQCELSSGVVEEKDSKNGSLISQLETKLQSRMNCVPMGNGSISSIGSKSGMCFA